MVVPSEEPERGFSGVAGRKFDPRGKIDVSVAEYRTRPPSSSLRDWASPQLSSWPRIVRVAAYAFGPERRQSLRVFAKKTEHPRLRGRTESSFSNKTHAPHSSSHPFHVQIPRRPRELS